MPNQIRICFVLADIHLGGGGERVTVNLSNEFVKRGFMVSILSMGSKIGEKIYTLSDKVVVEYLNLNILPGNIVKKTYVRIKSYFLVRKAIRTKEFPLIILGVGTCANVMISSLIKYGYYTVGCEHLSFKAVKGIWSFLRNISYSRLKGLVSLTYKDKQYLQKLNGNTHVIPNSVSFYPTEAAPLENKILLLAGRISSYQKGIDLFLDIYENIAKEIPEWKVRMVGRLTDNELKERVDKSEILKNRVFFAGETDSIQDEYMQAAIYVMTSRFEGFPMVLLEAQACGLPVISFDCETGPAEIVTDSENGFLIPCFDKNLMGRKIIELAKDYNLRKKMGGNARVNARKYLPEHIVPQWENLFYSLTGGKNDT